MRQLSSILKGCVLHMPLAEETYNPATRRFTDKSAFGNHATGIINATFDADRMGQTARAKAFVGSPDYVRIEDDGSLYTPSALSVFCWVKGASQHSKVIVAHYDNVLSQRSFQLSSATTTRMKAVISDDGTFALGHRKEYESSVDVLDGSWHNIGFTFDAGVFKLYVDGVEDTTPSKTSDDPITTIHNSTVRASIGCSFSNSAPTLHFTGSIDNVRIYNRALTPSEITYLYESYNPSVII